MKRQYCRTKSCRQHHCRRERTRSCQCVRALCGADRIAPRALNPHGREYCSQIRQNDNVKHAGRREATNSRVCRSYKNVAISQEYYLNVDHSAPGAAAWRLGRAALSLGKFARHAHGPCHAACGVALAPLSREHSIRTGGDAWGCGSGRWSRGSR